MSTGQGATDAHTLLTLEDIQRLAETKVYDGQGDLVSLGDITKGKKTALVFLRHLCECLKLGVTDVPSMGSDWSGVEDAFVTDLRVQELSVLCTVYERDDSA